MKSEVDTDHIKEVFGKTLVRLRTDAGLSQEKLANKARLERAYISRLERALVQPTITTIIKISDGLDVSPDKFFQVFLKDFQSRKIRK